MLGSTYLLLHREYFTLLQALEEVLNILFVLTDSLVYANNDKYPSPVIVFKDISFEGFTSPMWGALPFDKAKIAALTIAKFHAASIYLNENVCITRHTHPLINIHDIIYLVWPLKFKLSSLYQLTIYRLTFFFDFCRVPFYLILMSIFLSRSLVLQ